MIQALWKVLVSDFTHVQTLTRCFSLHAALRLVLAVDGPLLMLPLPRVVPSDKAGARLPLAARCLLVAQ